MTPESKRFVNECAKLAKRFSALYEQDAGLCSIDSNIDVPTVQMTDNHFLNYFGDSFEVVVRKSNQCPWKLVHMENGVKFFCITDKNPMYS